MLQPCSRHLGYSSEPKQNVTIEPEGRRPVKCMVYLRLLVLGNRSCCVGMWILLCGGPAEKEFTDLRGVLGRRLTSAIFSNIVRKGLTDKVTLSRNLKETRETA